MGCSNKNALSPIFHLTVSATECSCWTIARMTGVARDVTRKHAINGYGWHGGSADHTLPVDGPY